MRRPKFPPADELSASGSMTPMIDVVFLLLIFFVCAAAGQVHEDLLPTPLPPGDVSVPALPAPDEVPKDRLWVYLTRPTPDRTQIVLNDREYEDLAALIEVLRAIADLGPDSPVILDIEDDVPVGDMIRVYDAARTAGFETISFATEQNAL